MAGGAWWWQQQAAVEPAARTKAAQEVPDKPSIAVLPFNNMSGEASQDSFADGISEDLTTQLSKVSGLFVISRTTAFQYKGRSANIQQLAKELGVRYVVEGSVRRAGDQLRVNAQLIDAASGGHLWAETFDGVADEVFVLQDRINTKIVTALKVRLTPDEEKRVVSRGTENVEAYDAFRRGERLRLYTKVRVFEEAEEAYNRAIELDPNFGAAYAGLSHVVWSRARSFIQVSHREVLKSVWVLAEKSIVLGAASPGHAMLANLYLWEKFDHDRSESEARRAVAIDPNNSESIAVLAEVLIYAGKLDEARANLANAMRLDPGFPGRYSYLLGQEYFHAGKYRKSLEQMMDYCEGRVLSPRSGCLHYRASALGQLGEIEAGRKIINILIGGSRGRNLASIETTIAVNFPFSNDAGREQLMEGIRKVWSKE